MFAELERPIVGAPMAGGPSTVALAAAVSGAGGLGFLAGALVTPDALSERIGELRRTTDRPFGVNLFAHPGPAADPAAVAHYVASLGGEGGPLGDPRHDDDALEEKLQVVVNERPPVVSFTFGCPPAGVVRRLRDTGIAVWVTVTTPAEAAHAVDAGADALVVQGVEAGGHRGGFDDGAPGDLGLLALLQLVGAAHPDAPMVAAGGIVTGRGVAAVLAGGARAAQLGTALLRTPEAGTSAPHREALAGGGEPTGLTRAFSGRLARGIVNRFQRSHPDAPSAFPEIAHVTAPLRAAAGARGDADAVNLWAGQAYELAREAPAAEIVRDLADEARAILTPR